MHYFGGWRGHMHIPVPKGMRLFRMWEQWRNVTATIVSAIVILGALVGIGLAYGEFMATQGDFWSGQNATPCIIVIWRRFC